MATSGAEITRPAANGTTMRPHASFSGKAEAAVPEATGQNGGMLVNPGRLMNR